MRPRHRWWTARTRVARSSDLKTRSMGDEPTFGDKRRIHAYAFQRSTFPLPAGALVACAMPPADSEAASTPLTLRPHVLEDTDGPLVGYDRESRPVRLSSTALYGGVALLGEPGGGKSNSMHGIATHVARTLKPDDVMVMFESKGADSIPILRRVAPGLRVVDCMDPSTPMIDLLGSGTPSERAVRFADLMRQALGPNQIGPRSRIQIRDAVFAALTLMGSDGWEDRCRAAGCRVPRTWADAAGLLLGCDGIGAARLMGHAANMLGDADVDAAIERLHGGRTDSGRPKIADGRLAEQLSAPMNKMDILNQCPRLVRPGRRVVSWHAILSHGGRFAINIGAAERGAHDAMPEQTRRLVGALLFQGLRFEIERSCAGWQARGRRLDLFVDELTDVTGSDGTDGGSGRAGHGMAPREGPRVRRGGVRRHAEPAPIGHAPPGVVPGLHDRLLLRAARPRVRVHRRRRHRTGPAGRQDARPPRHRLLHGRLRRRVPAADGAVRPMVRRRPGGRRAA